MVLDCRDTYLCSATTCDANNLDPLTTGSADWEPDIRSSDLLAPETSLAALPAGSPAGIAVSWTGADLGGGSLAGFSIQVRHASGAWSDWIAGVPAPGPYHYQGMGGQSYEFRTRAGDDSGNIEDWPAGYDARTTVEALPPASKVNTLPAYTRGDLQVSWSGVDYGGSGIQYFMGRDRQPA